MVNFIKAFLGAGIIMFSIFFRFYFFTTDVLTHFGMSATDVYNITEKMAVFDPIYYTLTIGVGLFIILWSTMG